MATHKQANDQLKLLQKTIDACVETIDILEKDLETLQRQVDDLKKPQPAAWPQEGDVYYCIVASGSIDSLQWEDEPVDRELKDIGNCFPTREAAERELMRRKSMAKKYLPKKGESHYYVAAAEASASSTWSGSNYDWSIYHLGRTFRTEAEAQAWIDTYSKYWTEEGV